MAKKAGYKTHLYFIFTDNVELNIARVKLRVQQGQQDVDIFLIKSRYPRTFKLLPLVLALADEAFAMENSNEPHIITKKTSVKIGCSKICKTIY